MIERTLVWRNIKNAQDSLGKLGDETTLSSYKVGDVVAYSNLYVNGNLTIGIVCKDSSGSEYVMGLRGTSLRDLNAKVQLTKVISHRNLTDDILKEVNEAVKLKEVTVKIMTQSEIEDALGYKVKIV